MSITKQNPSACESSFQQEYRHLTTEEKFLVYKISLTQRSCCFCTTPVYCAENLCNCVNSKRILRSSTLEENIYRRPPNNTSSKPNKEQLVEFYPSYYDL